MVFYRSFYEAIKELSPDDFRDCVEAIMEYGLNDIEPESPGVAKAIFIMAKPQIDANNKRYENGTKGGRPLTKNNQSITKNNQSITKANQSITKPEPKEKVKEKDKEKVNVNISPTESETAPMISFALKDGTMYDVSENDVDKFQQLYPSIDVMQELRAIVGWCDANPKDRKTRSGAKRFLNGWMNRAQRSVNADGDCTKDKANAFHNFDQREYDYDALEEQLSRRPKNI